MGKNSIISGQKPARRKRRHAEASRRKVAFAAGRFLAIVILVALAIFLPGYIASRIQSGFKSIVTSRSTKVEFLGNSGALADFDRDTLQSRISEAVHVGKDLDDIARLAGTLAPLARVDVIRTAPDRLVVSFERREPAMRIERGSTRLIDSSGFVYGSCCSLPAQEAEAQLTLLTGIPVVNPDGGITQREELSLIREALALKDGLATKSVKASMIRFQTHRGFFAVMDPDGIEVAMGQAPFEEKLDRLAEVLKRIDRQKVSKIELDYHGKAFIKERKL